MPHSNHSPRLPLHGLIRNREAPGGLANLALPLMNLTIHWTFLPHTDADASLAFYRDVLGFEVRKDVGANRMRWITVGPANQPQTSVVLNPPEAADLTDDEHKLLDQMIEKGHYMLVFATDDLDQTYEQIRAGEPTSYRSSKTTRTASATAPSATPPATSSASSRPRSRAGTSPGLACCGHHLGPPAAGRHVLVAGAGDLHREDRHRGLQQDSLGRAAEDEFADRAAAAEAEDDERDVVRGGGLEEFGGDVAGADGLLDGDLDAASRSLASAAASSSALA